MTLQNIRILLALTALSTLLAMGIYFNKNSNNVEIKKEPLIKNFDQLLSQIKTINISSAEDTTTIIDNGEQWVVENAQNMPANTELLSKFFIQLREAKIIEAKTNKEELLYKLGLDDKNTKSLTLQSSADEVIFSLDIGNYNYKIPGTYIKMSGTSQSYLVDVNLSTDASIFNWVPNDLMNIGSERISSVQIYNEQMINLRSSNNQLVHQNLPNGYSSLSQNRIDEIENILIDIQHNGFLEKKELPKSSDLDARISLSNGTILFMSLYDIPEKGIHVTFDWNYINEEIEISKFINLDMSGSQLQISSLSLLNDVAYNVPQKIFDALNLKLREE